MQNKRIVLLVLSALLVQSHAMFGAESEDTGLRRSMRQKRRAEEDPVQPAKRHCATVECPLHNAMLEIYKGKPMLRSSVVWGNQVDPVLLAVVRDVCGISELVDPRDIRLCRFPRDTWGIKWPMTEQERAEKKRAEQALPLAKRKGK